LGYLENLSGSAINELLKEDLHEEYVVECGMEESERWLIKGME
jgi:hypothetical protein